MEKFTYIKSIIILVIFKYQFGFNSERVVITDMAHITVFVEFMD